MSGIPTDEAPASKSGGMNETDLAADLEEKLKIDSSPNNEGEHASTTTSALDATENIPVDSVAEEATKPSTHETAGTDDTASDAPPPTLVQIAHWVEQARHILVLTGAGVSVAAGIPDFRTPGTGLYDNLAKYKLPYAEAVFDIEYYPNNPHPFVQLAAELWPDPDDPKCPKPTLTHCFVTLLAEKGKLLRNYSQVMLTPEFSVCYLCRVLISLRVCSRLL
jgi:Sir2 family